MKVATRITVATAVVVALASATYAYFDLRGRRTERIGQLEREARAVGGTLRLNLEVQGSAFRIPGDAQLKELQRATGGWRVKIVPRSRKDEPAGMDLSDEKADCLAGRDGHCSFVETSCGP